MQPLKSNVVGGPDRYSAKKTAKPINFHCIAPEARHVSLIGDFNNWEPNANPMKRLPDGAWFVQVPLCHGHHTYLFLIDGIPVIDKRAQGTVRNSQNQKVSLIAVS
jgi:1,4-alpha-glucan branching enzyme